MRDLVPVGLDGEHQARADGRAVEEDGAGAADAVLAAEMGAGEPDILAERVGEGPPRLDLDAVLLAVYRSVIARRSLMALPPPCGSLP